MAIHMKENPLTCQYSKLLDAAEAIRLDPDKIEAAFIARQLVQATLPHKNPGDIPAWRRANGNLTLTIRSGWDTKQGKAIGYPYGTIPRLLLFWITTEAVRTKNPRLELGNHLASFMRELGLDPSTGRGKRGDAVRLCDQMQRLFRATISFDQSEDKKEAWLDMQVAPKGMFWWDEKQPDQPTLWGSWIQLGEDFFNAITAAPVPVDMRSLKALKRSPLALDLYAWATYSAYRTQQNGQSRSVSWEALHEQLGAEYHDMKEFAKSARAALRKVQAVYPELGLKFEKGGVKVLPCNPAIILRAKRQKPVDSKSYHG